MTAFRPVPATGFMPLAAVFDLDHTLIAGDATIAGPSISMKGAS